MTAGYGYAQVWDVITGAMVNSTDALWVINDALFTSSGVLLVGSNDQENMLQIWDVGRTRRVYTLERGEVLHQDDVVASQDGTLIAAVEAKADTNTRVRIWQTSTGKEQAAFETGPVGTAANGRALSLTSNRILATYNGYDSVAVWNIDTGRKVHQMATVGAIYGIQTSDDGRLLAAGGSKSVYIWDTATGKLLAEFPIQVKGAEEIAVATLAFSPDGSVLAAGGGFWNEALYNSAKGTIWLFDTQALRPLGTLDEARHLIGSLDFSADGTLLVSAPAVEIDYVRLWAVPGR